MDLITLAMAKKYSDSNGAVLPVVEITTPMTCEGLFLSKDECAALDSVVEMGSKYIIADLSIGCYIAKHMTDGDTDYFKLAYKNVFAGIAKIDGTWTTVYLGDIDG